MTPWGDFGGILFENAPDPKLALGKGFSLLPEMSFSEQTKNIKNAENAKKARATTHLWNDKLA